MEFSRASALSLRPHHWIAEVPTPSYEQTGGSSATCSHTYYATKDHAVVEDAAYGLMWWDAESKGTLNSVTFQNIRSLSDVVGLLINCDRASVQRCERELGIAHVRHRAPLP